MAKSKRELRRLLGSYADAVVRYKKREQALRQQLGAWEQVSRLNQALVAAVLVQCAGLQPVRLPRQSLDCGAEGYVVQVQVEEGAYVLQAVKREGRGGPDNP